MPACVTTTSQDGSESPSWTPCGILVPRETGNEEHSDVAYLLTDHGRRELAAFGIDFEQLPRRCASVRYCIDWAEKRHHLAGALGSALTARKFALQWLRRGTYRRVVHLTDTGREGIETTFGVPTATVL